MKYVVSGISPGFGGVGKLMEYLTHSVDKEKFTFIYPKIFRFKNKYVRWFFNKISKDIFFNIKVSFIKDKELILMHHQSLGLKLSKKLIENNEIDFYVMDNSFFCVKSYNFIDGSNKECLSCIDSGFNEVIKNSCQPFPIKYSMNENIEFLRFLKKNSKKMNFYTLCNSNALLLKKHFGNVNVQTIRFLTYDILNDQYESEKVVSKYDQGFDIVYHGASVNAKGFSYVKELAVHLPHYNFLIPSENNDKNKPSNLIYKSMTWETGLKEEVINAKLILTPSLWSSTTEAASLKSFLFNGNVGMIKNRYSFTNDLDNDVYINLTGILTHDIEIINNFLLNREYKTQFLKGKNYIKNYIEMSKKSMKKLF